MEKSDFLDKLLDEGKLKLAEPSENVCESYLQKAANSLKSSRVLLQNKLYEDSVSMSYYAMYNSLLALLFRVGIKSENHSASILVFKKIFGRSDLYKMIAFAKKERIDKQYYVDFVLTKESAEDLTEKAEHFTTELRLIIKSLRNEDIRAARSKFESI